jgi:hypothetical protein
VTKETSSFFSLCNKELSPQIFPTKLSNPNDLNNCIFRRLLTVKKLPEYSGSRASPENAPLPFYSEDFFTVRSLLKMQWFKWIRSLSLVRTMFGNSF